MSRPAHTAMPLLRATSWRRTLAIVMLTASAPAQRFAGQFLTQSDGLPHNWTTSAAQTSDGLLWFGSRGGVIRNDCVSWQLVNDFQPSAVTSIYRVTTDDAGELWAFDEQPPFAGWRRRADGSWVALPANPLTVDSPRQLRMLAVAGARDDAVAMIGTLDGQLCLLHGGRWHEAPGSRRAVRAIERAGDRLLVAHAGGVDAFDRRSPTAPARTFEGVRPGALALAHDPSLGATWVVGPNWIGVLEGDQFRVVRDDSPPMGLGNPPVVMALPDGRGGLHFGDRATAFHLRANGELFDCPPDDAMVAIGSTRVLRDREGIVWVAGQRGIAQLGNRNLLSYCAADGLLEDEVASLLELRDGRIVAGHNGGLTFLGDTMRTLRLPGHGRFTRVMAMVQDRDGDLILAADKAGVLRVDIDTLTVDEVAIPPSARTVQSVAVDDNGDVLAACWNDLYRLHRDGVERIPTGLGDYRNVHIRHVTSRGDDVFLTVRGLGVLRIAGDGTRRWIGGEGEQRNATCCSPRTAAELWVGSSLGLLRSYDGSALEPVELGGRRIDRPVYSICDDRQGRIWLGTSRGAMVWDGRNLVDLCTDVGVIGNENNRGANLCDRHGRMWLGFDRGITVFDPQLELPVAAGPVVRFETPIVDGAARATDWGPVHSHRSVRFPLLSMSARDGRQLLHSFRLEPFDDDWSEPAPLPQRQVTYHNLPADRYRLHVRAIDSAGVATTVTSPWIEVLPPWWLGMPFLVALLSSALVLIGAVGAFVAQRRHARGLERAVSERTADLRDERNRLHATLTNLSDGVIGVDHDGRIGLWTPTAARLTGIDGEAAVGRTLAELLPALGDPVPSSSSEPAEAVATTLPDGRTRWFETSAASTGTGHILVLRDVTERREQERLLNRNERLESIGVLAGGIAHDFNNLLAIMLGNLSLLETSSDLDAGGRAEMHGHMHQAMLRARDLTQQLLTFSRGGAPVRRPGSLRPLLTEGPALALSGANVGLEVQVAEDLPPVAFDHGQLSQVVHNLVLNARQAMPDGGTVLVRADNEPEPPEPITKPAVVIEVADDGPGVAPADLERIFDPYYSTKPGGTGLGLSTCHSIVKRHDGVLTVASSPGGGATFRVYLPATRQAAPATAPARPDADRGADDGGLKVLCMDDERAVRGVLRTILERLGHTVEVANDGREAIARFEHARAAGAAFDLVLLDITVPGGMGGLEALEHLRRLADDLVAIATTGYSTEPVAADYARRGFRAVLGKPFDIDDVAEAVQRARRGSAEPRD